MTVYKYASRQTCCKSEVRPAFHVPETLETRAQSKKATRARDPYSVIGEFGVV